MSARSSFASRWWLLLALAGMVAPSSSGQQIAPKSGVLVGLNTGQTLWIAPVDGKIQAIAADDYVIPRKDGFWRVRLEVLWPLATARQTEAGSEAPSADSTPESVVAIYGRLWAVPLKKGKDAVPWVRKPAEETAKEAEGQDQPAESVQQSQPENQIHRQELTFLSPDYISFHTQSGEYSEENTLLKITDAPAAPGSVEGLLVHPEEPPISKEILQKDLDGCAEPGNELNDADFLSGAGQSFGIVRARRKWAYAWLLGYSGGALRGYHTSCGVSVLPPKDIVGYDQPFPGWNAIKEMYPDAEDAFPSPAHDLVLIFYGNKLIVAPVHDGKVGRSLARIEVNGKPVMVQWATGNYVDEWTKELTPYFETYVPSPAKNQQ